jgi:hypothetical protein
MRQTLLDEFCAIAIQGQAIAVKPMALMKLRRNI